jgi:hypothetical protein
MEEKFIGLIWRDEAMTAEIMSFSGWCIWTHMLSARFYRETRC